jgi:hypothetical protein
MANVLKGVVEVSVATLKLLNTILHIQEKNKKFRGNFHLRSSHDRYRVIERY